MKSTDHIPIWIWRFLRKRTIELQFTHTITILTNDKAWIITNVNDKNKICLEVIIPFNVIDQADVMCRLRYRIDTHFNLTGDIFRLWSKKEFSKRLEELTILINVYSTQSRGDEPREAI
jgi:hypothetical protein